MGSTRFPGSLLVGALAEEMEEEEEALGMKSLPMPTVRRVKGWHSS